MLRARQTEVRHDDRNEGDDEGLLAEQDAASCSRCRCRSLHRTAVSGDRRQVPYRHTALKRWLSRRTNVGSPDGTASDVSFSAVLF